MFTWQGALPLDAPPIWDPFFELSHDDAVAVLTPRRFQFGTNVDGSDRTICLEDLQDAVDAVFEAGAPEAAEKCVNGQWAAVARRLGCDPQSVVRGKRIYSNASFKLKNVYKDLRRELLRYEASERLVAWALAQRANNAV